ncbi:MAG: deoxyribodipyrimidine photolyase [Candidatus Eisenbacteria bacterium]|nr:deoxyribodipyrimidine photolyase [Candidatus Eisenbacteria bacterium]
MAEIPQSRVRCINDAPVRDNRDFVLYWMIANRRLGYNFSLERALRWCRELNKPLVILEALRCDYPWASDRLHRFILDGMAENARRLTPARIAYYPYVEPRAGAGKGLLQSLGRKAAVVVTDDYPAFFLPRAVAAAGRKLDTALEAVDSNGLLPQRLPEQLFKIAYSFRRYLQQELPRHLDALPRRYPLRGIDLPAALLPAAVTRRWPRATADLLAGDPQRIGELPLDHSVPPAPQRGGYGAARATLERFLDEKLNRYAEDQSHPDAAAASNLSPYLHFGHIAAQEIFLGVAEREGWSPGRLASHSAGARSGWWGMSAGAEAFLDQLMTWRELGFNMCVERDDYDEYRSLPDWARATLEEHASDERPYRYTPRQFTQAETHDPLWNAAQRQLLQEGRLHNYMRMLWGKKILEWSADPRQALEIMIELNNRYALDGRDPNSYSGIFWILGRYDRPWGPERMVFGTVRYMSSRNTRRKLKLTKYLERFAPDGR